MDSVKFEAAGPATRQTTIARLGDRPWTDVTAASFIAATCERDAAAAQQRFVVWAIPAASHASFASLACSGAKGSLGTEVFSVDIYCSRGIAAGNELRW